MTEQLDIVQDQGRLAGAVISDCEQYRYRLWRQWAPGERVLWIMLNPSTADGLQDDPTIRRCMGFACQWGYGGINVVNLCAHRATRPAELLRAPDPMGPENHSYIATALDTDINDLVVCAWGAIDTRLYEYRDTVLGWIEVSRREHVYCLGTTRMGEPRHPLMLRKDTPLEVYEP